MDPRELLEVLEEKVKEEPSDIRGTALLYLLRRVVARLDELGETIFREAPTSTDDRASYEAVLSEYVELMGPALFGDLKPLPDRRALGVTDAETALENQRVFGRRADARESGWYIEAIALTAYQLEEWLRTWIVSKGGGDTFHPEDRHQLGHLIEQARNLELEPALIARLEAFNKTRNQAIHRLLRGEVAYKDLAAAYDMDIHLPEDLLKWVIKEMPNFAEAAPEWNSLERWIRWAKAHPETD